MDFKPGDLVQVFDNGNFYDPHHPLIGRIGTVDEVHGESIRVNFDPPYEGYISDSALHFAPMPQNCL